MGSDLSTAGIVLEAARVPQRLPGGMRGCRMSLRDYYTSVSYNMYGGIQEASLVMQGWY